MRLANLDFLPDAILELMAMDDTDTIYWKKEYPMRMEKRTFRIGELAKQLNIQPFVIRFWEKEFDLRPSRSMKKQRFYTQKDYDTFILIKELLYQKGYTISGARKALGNNPRIAQSHITIIAPQKTAVKATIDPLPTPPIQQLQGELISLKQQLQKLYKML